MKNLFNNISQEEKQRILEMHKGAKMVFGEQAVMRPNSSNSANTKTEIYIGNTKVYDGQNWVSDDNETSLLIANVKRNMEKQKLIKPGDDEGFLIQLKKWAGKQNVDASIDDDASFISLPVKTVEVPKTTPQTASPNQNKI